MFMFSCGLFTFYSHVPWKYYVMLGNFIIFTVAVHQINTKHMQFCDF